MANDAIWNQYHESTAAAPEDTTYHPCLHSDWHKAYSQLQATILIILIMFVFRALLCQWWCHSQWTVDRWARSTPPIASGGKFPGASVVQKPRFKPVTEACVKIKMDGIVTWSYLWKCCGISHSLQIYKYSYSQCSMCANERDKNIRPPNSLTMDNLQILQTKLIKMIRQGDTSLYQELCHK